MSQMWAALGWEALWSIRAPTKHSPANQSTDRTRTFRPAWSMFPVAAFPPPRAAHVCGKYSDVHLNALRTFWLCFKLSQPISNRYKSRMWTALWGENAVANQDASCHWGRACTVATIIGRSVFGPRSDWLRYHSHLPVLPSLATWSEDRVILTVVNLWKEPIVHKPLSELRKGIQYTNFGTIYVLLCCIGEKVLLSACSRFDATFLHQINSLSMC